MPLFTIDLLNKRTLPKVEEEDWGVNYELVILIDPGNYRALDEAFNAINKGAVHAQRLRESIF